jgi:hypothetical protein
MAVKTERWTGVTIKPAAALGPKDSGYLLMPQAKRRLVLRHLAYADWAHQDQDNETEWLRKAARLLLAAELPNVQALAFVARAIVESHIDYCGEPREWWGRAYDAVWQEGDPTMGDIIGRKCFG